MENIVINLINASINNDNVDLLQDVNFSLAEAELAYLVGRTGSGKSSLLKLLYGAYQLSDGYAKVLEFDLKTLDQKQIPILRRKLGIIYQNYSLFEGWTVYENLDFVLRATDWKVKADRNIRIGEVLKDVNLSNKAQIEVNRLSGGEQQRLTIARSILNHPKLILADEPTGSLDPESADEILYLLHNIARNNGTAMIIATHDYRLLEKFPARIYDCVNKTIVERDSK